MTRKVSVKAMMLILTKLDIDPASVMVNVEDQHIGDLVFGSLSNGTLQRELLEQDDEMQTIRVATSLIKSVLGGVSSNFLRKGHIDGIDYLGDGFCNVDLGAEIFKINNITKEDIKRGTQKMYRSADAAEVVNHQNPSIDRLNISDRLPSHPTYRQKYGKKLWLWNKEKIDSVEYETASNRRLKLVK
jgi:hypothetical protein